MMNVLSIEAGGAQIGLSALCTAKCTAEHPAENEKSTSQVLAGFVSDEPRSLSRELIFHIDHTLSRAAWELSDVDVIAVGIGPASWTSLRIALATCKTLAQTREIALCGIPSFDAWAHAAAAQVEARVTAQVAATKNTIILTTARCRPGEIYGKLFAFEYSNNGLKTRVLIAEEVHSAVVWRELVSQLNNNNWPVVVCGEAHQTVMEVGEQGTEHQNLRSFESVEVPIADVAFQIARLGAQRAARGESDDALLLQPLYIGVSNAERVLQEKQLLQNRMQTPASSASAP